MWFFFKPITVIFNIIKQNTKISVFLYIFFDWILLSICNIKKNEVDKDIAYYNYKKYWFFSTIFIFWLDFFFLVLLSKLYLCYKNNKTGNIIRLKQKQSVGNQFYLNNNKQDYFYFKTQVMFGFKSIWKHIKFWVLPLTILFLFFYYSFFLKSLPFSKTLFGYILLCNMFYLFISGFVWFYKKYQYRLYTSAIQRFWRRTLIFFWLIEASLFSVFVYLIFNASQEPIHVYDNIQIYKTHFYSWRFFLLKVILSSLLIILTYMLLLSVKWNTFTKTNNISLFITFILLYIAWLEFYQLFHLMNCYGTSNWVYDFNEHLWNLELEFKRTRIVNHYVTIGLVAKFWHIVFAVVFWFFFILRGVESSRYRYPLLVANIQNFLIIYIMSWLYMYPWFKYVLRKSLDIPYFWFFVNNRKLGLFIFFNDIKLFTMGLFDFFFNRLIFFKKSSYYYWYETSINLGYVQFRKHNIRDIFLRNLS